MEILLLTDMAVDVHAMLRESLCRALASRALSARRSTDCVAAAKRPSVAVAQFSFSDGIRVFCKPTTQLRDAHLAVLATSTCERSSLVDGFGGEADAAGGQTAHAAAHSALAALLHAGVPGSWAGDGAAAAQLPRVTIFVAASPQPWSEADSRAWAARCDEAAEARGGRPAAPDPPAVTALRRPHDDPPAATRAIKVACTAAWPQRLLSVQLIVLETPPPDAAAAAAAALARRSVSDAVAACDNADAAFVPLDALRIEGACLDLLFSNTRGGPAPHAAAVSLRFRTPPAPGFPSTLRLALRCDVIALVDGARPVRLCRCHGCSLLSPDSAMSASDVQAFAAALGKRDTCPLTGKPLAPADVVPNCVLLGRDTVLQLPTFDDLPGGGGAAADAPVVLAAVATVHLPGVSEAVLFGYPWARPHAQSNSRVRRAAERDAHGGAQVLEPPAAAAEEGGDEAETAAEAELFAALVAALAARDDALLISCAHNLDAGRPALSRAFYLALPQVAHPGALAPPPPSLLLRRCAAREEVLPSRPAARARAPPRAVAVEAANALLEGLGHQAEYDPGRIERGVHRQLAALLSRSMQLPAALPPGAAEARKAAAAARCGKGAAPPEPEAGWGPEPAEAEQPPKRGSRSRGGAAAPAAGTAAPDRRLEFR